MYKKGTGNDKQGKDAGNRTLSPYRHFSQAIMKSTTSCTEDAVQFDPSLRLQNLNERRALPRAVLNQRKFCGGVGERKHYLQL